MDTFRSYALQIPSDILDRYHSWSWTTVSVHPGNSAMYRLSDDDGASRYLKIVRCGWTPSAEAEAERTIWAGTFLPVPQVLETGLTGHCSWILTQAIPGVDATDERFQTDVAGLVRRLAEGLRRFHRAPREACPFSFRLDDALQHVEYRLRTGQIDAGRDFHAEHARLSPEAAFEELVRNRPKSEDLVVCHGDYCAPNVLLRDNLVVGYVDLGELGVADRWWDLAVATWSVTWNFGPGYEDAFLAAYGVDSDERRTRYYRLLYDLAS